jgi:hypothetical protein
VYILVIDLLVSHFATKRDALAIQDKAAVELWDYKSVVRMFAGLLQCGVWGCY